MDDLLHPDAPALSGVVPPPRLRAVMARAHQDLRKRVFELAPGLAAELSPWMMALAPAGQPPEAYFAHPLAFPMLSLPWWLDEALAGGPDLGRQRDLIRSSMAGYYLIRLIDDVMDASPAARPELLPAVGVLHLQFQSALSPHLPSDDPFWPAMEALWARGHEAAVLDARMTDLDREGFRRFAGQKVCGAEIPLLAVARWHGQDVPEAWRAFFTELCPWHQLHNDLFDWQRDAAAQRVTWFLCEGRRRKGEGEALPTWVVREGFELGVDWLREGLDELDGLARAAGSPALVGYVAGRARLLEAMVARVRPSLELLRQLIGPATGRC